MPTNYWLHISTTWVTCTISFVWLWLLPRRRLPCHGRRWRCCSGPLWSRPVAASPSPPASYSSCWTRHASHHCCMWKKVGALLLHLPTGFLHGAVAHCWRTYLVGDTTSKQKRRSRSSQCFTVQSRKSSTTTVGLSWWKRSFGYKQNVSHAVFADRLELSSVAP